MNLKGCPLILICFLLGATTLRAQAPGPPELCPIAASDADHDGLSDQCELNLAQHFAPVLIVRSGGCNWDDSVTPARPGGEYLYAVQSVDSATMRIAYLPAYYRDCGWHGLKCRLPVVDCAPHVGDSEFMVIETRREHDTWSVAAIFLSAHCFGKYGQACKWYRGPDLERFTWEGARAVIWVAEGRQANYPTKRACDAGIHHIDTCDHNSLRIRYPVLSHQQNIGSRKQPGHDRGCIAAGSIWNSTREATGTSECFWDPKARFAGWQPERTGVTPYYTYLSVIAEFGAR